ncbi:hypothetical protein [Jannaschia formosa]|uniref:hypothetical protein n=1 Tax=Jannaschia formosa TaxID=2259592 RepID=UPI000E1BDFEF|nr:hypothetical protein [Jannaschia formosa]TFL19390.1 hypothetical protein DR046_05570 [Jannaschia formosa]
MGLGAVGLIGALRALPLLATAAATGWMLSTNPLARPFVDRSTTELALALEARVARVATAEWLQSALDGAVAEGDSERAAMFLSLADELGRPIYRDPAETLVARADSPLAQAAGCGACMADTARCESVRLLAACAVPFELSPLGDLNALRRAGLAWGAGEEVDRVDAGLALLGLGATAAVLASGGSSASVKAGAGLLRMARRMGSLSPALARQLDLPVRWAALPGYLRGTARLEDVTDTARLARIGALAREMEAVRRATSTPEALRLLRHVDGPEDAARLARLAEAAGPRTPQVMAVLGKSRAFRATLRLSRTAAATLALVWLTATQLAILLATRAGALLWRRMLD